MDAQDIKRYFLTAQDELRQEEIDLTADSETFSFAEQIESELVDDYVLGNLSSLERVAFESCYLNSEARKEKVAEAQRLVRIAAVIPDDASVPSAKPLSGWISDMKIAFAFAAAIVVAICLIAYSVVRKESPMEIAKTEPSRSVESVETLAPPAPGVSTEINEAPKAKIEKQSKRFTPATISLSPRNFRNQGREIVISVDDTRVPFLLKLETEPGAQLFSTYSIKVETPEGADVAVSATVQQISKTSVTVSVIGKLTPGTFIVYLAGFDPDGSSQPVAEYAFRVVAE